VCALQEADAKIDIHDDQAFRDPMCEGDSDSGGGSAPCLLHELSADGTAVVDPQQARDVARWRKVQRERLLATRMAIEGRLRAQQTAAVKGQLNLIVPGDGRIVSLYWPIRGEPDLREWMRERVEQGTRIALPVATAYGRPLEFREWRPGAKMARGLWKIPYPADGAELQPEIVVAPLVGFDRRGFRLGYGGGFFDRTLARLTPRPLVIGVGYASSELESIFPQPHDIGMDWILTDVAPPRRFLRDTRAQSADRAACVDSTKRVRDH
jgi:5,10-methenyltetrahydrofolate synthetase